MRSDIDGTEVSLVPLSPDLHAETLFDLFLEEKTWIHLRDGPFKSVEDYQVHLEQYLLVTAFAGFVIQENRTGDVLGKMSLLHADPVRNRVEIGYVVFGAQAKGTYLGKQALAVLIDTVFATYGFEVCEWRCNARNIPSAKLASKFCFEQTAEIQNHMVVKGAMRDTKIFELNREKWNAQRGAILRSIQK
ncbi:GNAT family N-acetyltransferase [Cochlodiniinecator piscidefendens]|uniref:GNAT family N-acetyltransferase n=1 Tax=Cochlodiniinecator piscidefendens TaxID=2715756 RepID=UPI00140CAAC7|nr:GNAT family protein [Cochlodiniinecator piscidefendens]